MTKIFEMLQVLKNKMKENKKLTIILSIVSVLLVAAIVVTLILVLNNKNTSDDTSKTEWPEAGVYYYDSGKDE